MPVTRLVSGGQTGVDRAALDAAVALGLPYGGWCPRGGRAEDHPWPPGVLRRYPGLRQTPDDDPAVRTRWNVRDSDATLVLISSALDSSPGTALTVETATRLGRPWLLAAPADAGAVRAWLATLDRAVTLDVAGPRETEEPGVYAATLATLLAVLGHRAD